MFKVTNCDLKHKTGATFEIYASRIYGARRCNVKQYLEAIKVKLELLERNDEENLEAINDLSEDMRQEIDTIYQAIAALSVKEPSQPEPPRNKIGFMTCVDK